MSGKNNTPAPELLRPKFRKKICAHLRRGRCGAAAYYKNKISSLFTIPNVACVRSRRGGEQKKSARLRGALPILVRIFKTNLI